MKIMLLGFLLTFCSVLSAQKITVYYFEGDASLLQDGKSVPLQENAIIESQRIFVSH